MKINKSLEMLNEKQKEAVLNKDKVCMVNASVGSGKTTVLTNKVLYVIDELKVPIDDIVCLTFTNKASNEIKERVNAIFENEIEMQYLGTFHSVAMKLLKTKLKIEELGFSSDFMVITPEEESELANELIEENSLNIKYKNKLTKRLEKFEYGITHYGIMKKDDDIEILVKLLKERKIKNNQMTFSDLINFSIFQLNKGYYKAKWVIVDEFQDCDSHQLDFINALSDENTHIFVVGDPNQVIYSWRGGNCNVFERFKNKYNCTELSLPINYRSSSSILDVAKVFLKNASSLEGIRDRGSKIAVKNHYDAFQEAQYLAEQIKQKVQSNELKYKDIAIFYRMQKQSEVLKQVFLKENIPYEISMKKTVNDIPVLRWFIKLLKFSINPNDIVSYYAVFCNDEFGKNLPKKLAKTKFKTGQDDGLLLKCKNFKAFLSDSDINQRLILDYFQIDKYLYPSSSEFEENKNYIVKFLNEIQKFAVENNVKGVEALINFLNSASLYGLDLLNEQVNLSSDSVKLMTLHASKGLEFKQVYIIGVNFGLIPISCKSIEEYEEEKRLFFVGITRAKDNLELSYYTNTNDVLVSSGPSSFISMIPRDLIEYSNDFVEHKSNLQSLKRSLFERKNAKMACESKTSETVEMETSKTEIAKIEEHCQNEFYIHKKYGVGEKVSETDDIITLKFKGYGEKSFYKMFNEVQKYEKN